MHKHRPANTARTPGCEDCWICVAREAANSGQSRFGAVRILKDSTEKRFQHLALGGLSGEPLHPVAGILFPAAGVAGRQIGWRDIVKFENIDFTIVEVCSRAIFSSLR